MRNPTNIFTKLFSTLITSMNWLIQRNNRLDLERNLHRLPRRVHTLASIEIDRLKTCNIGGIILDLDNTIVSEDDRYLSPWAEDWIRQVKLAGLEFFILSNGNRLYRVKFWSHRLDIPSISPSKKPFSSGFRHAMAHMQLPSKQVVVIGDSLHTDIMGAWLCGCHYIQVASLPHPLHWWEKLVGRWVQIPYSSEGELWEFDDVVGYERFF